MQTPQTSLSRILSKRDLIWLSDKVWFKAPKLADRGNVNYGSHMPSIDLMFYSHAKYVGTIEWDFSIQYVHKTARKYTVHTSTLPEKNKMGKIPLDYRYKK